MMPQIHSQAFGWLTSIANIRFWVYWFPALLGATLVHEIGHVLAGWIVGFHFNGIQIAWFSLGLDHGKLTFHVRREVSQLGAARFRIDRIYSLRRRGMIFIAGGPATNILSVVVTVVTVNAFDFYKSWLAMPAACFVFASVWLGLLSLVPGPDSRSDGARLKMCFTSRDKSRRWFCLLALANQIRIGKSPKLWNSNWTKTAASVRDSSREELSACWLAYMCSNARKHSDLAAGYLERCLTLAGLFPHHYAAALVHTQKEEQGKKHRLLMEKAARHRAEREEYEWLFKHQARVLQDCLVRRRRTDWTRQHAIPEWEKIYQAEAKEKKLLHQARVLGWGKEKIHYHAHKHSI